MPVTIHTQAAREAQTSNLPRLAALTETPIGTLALIQRGDFLSELRLQGEVFAGETLAATPLLTKAIQQLGEYFNGERTDFDLPLAPLGTPFQTLVWEHLAHDVPYGRSVSYGELAKLCYKPAASRAVGMANHRNPLPIVIPCHRVIGADGSLVGYGGGLPMKQFLLQLEKIPFKART